MAIEGFIDEIGRDGESVRGWVYDNGRPDASLGIEVVVGDKVVARATADGFRPDLRDAGKGNGKHGFQVMFKGGSALLSPRVRVTGQRFFLKDPSEQWSTRTQAGFHHTLEFGLPAVPFGFTGEPTLEREAECIERLVSAFRRATADTPRSARKRLEDVWLELEGYVHTPFLRLLERDDRPGLAAYLRQVHAQGLTHGITLGEKASAGLRDNPSMAGVTAAQYADRLTSLAEYLGVIRVQCPEQTADWGTSLHAPVAETIAAIEKRVGFPIAPSNPPGGSFGITTKSGIVSDRDLQALYAAWRLVEVGALAGVDKPAVVEIGGGAGGVAYYAAKLGLPTYTIIDLPLINLLQGYCLMCTLGPGAVTLYGEPPTKQTSVRLMPTWTFEAGAETYDLLLNQDSFPEMHADYATGYLRAAREKVRHFVLSINQEARAFTAGAHQTAVADMVVRAGGGKRLLRTRHWLRPGYVEEIYRSR